MRRTRVVIAKPGLDGHDRGAKVIARALRDAGMEVIYTGLRQTPEQIVSAALQEDADVIGLSILSGAHLHIVTRVRELLRAQGLDDVVLLVGGIIPDADVPALKALGVGGIFPPGSPMQAIIDFISEAVRFARERSLTMSTSTLLLVDDSVTIQRVIELTFADENVRVVSVGDGRRAQQWMERQAPDIVLVDVGAPEMDGYAVANYVRQSPRLKHVPVLILAGVFEPVDEARAREAGSDGVLVKPFEPEHLVTRVRSLLHDAASRAAEDAGDGQTRASVVTPFPGVTRLAVAPPPATIEDTAEALGRSVRDAREAVLPSRMSLANAFSTLLATDQAGQPAAAPAQPLLTDVMVEEAVRRALVRMTEGVVRRIVGETAERLIKEEIDKIKSQSE